MGCWPASVASNPTQSPRSRSPSAPTARARVSPCRCSPRCATTRRGGASPNWSRPSVPTGRTTPMSRCRPTRSECAGTACRLTPGSGRTSGPVAASRRWHRAPWSSQAHSRSGASGPGCHSTKPARSSCPRHSFRCTATSSTGLRRTSSRTWGSCTSRENESRSATSLTATGPSWNPPGASPSQRSVNSAYWHAVASRTLSRCTAPPNSGWSSVRSALRSADCSDNRSASTRFRGATPQGYATERPDRVRATSGCAAIRSVCPCRLRSHGIEVTVTSPGYVPRSVPTYRDPMTRFSIDPTTFLQLAWTERRPHSSHQLVAPNSLRLRSLELLLGKVRAGQIDDRVALEIHERLTEVKVRLLGDRVSRRTAWNLARRFDWEDLADAECLAVTKLQADALVTIDAGLASKAAHIVPLAPLDDLFTE